jgi:hypothetical protein
MKDRPMLQAYFCMQDIILKAQLKKLFSVSVTPLPVYRYFAAMIQFCFKKTGRESLPHVYHRNKRLLKLSWGFSYRHIVG